MWVQSWFLLGRDVHDLRLGFFLNGARVHNQAEAEKVTFDEEEAIFGGLVGHE